MASETARLIHFLSLFVIFLIEFREG